MDRWIGRVALVTGASGGIGFAIVRTLAQKGMKVVGAARNIESIKALEAELRNSKCPGSVLPVACDLTKDDQVFAMFETTKTVFGGIDVCINNAGTSFSSSLLDGNPNEWRTMMNLNVVALCLCTKLAVANMRERNVDDGHIINISSVAGHSVSPIGPIHFYAGTKFAVRAINEGLRQEMREAKSHIRISAISPGLVKTELLDRLDVAIPALSTFLKGIQVMHPEDIAAIVVTTLASPKHVEINDVIVRPTQQI